MTLLNSFEFKISAVIWECGFTFFSTYREQEQENDKQSQAICVFKYRQQTCL